MQFRTIYLLNKILAKIHLQDIVSSSPNNVPKRSSLLGARGNCIQVWPQLRMPPPNPPQQSTLLRGIKLPLDEFVLECIRNPQFVQHPNKKQKHPRPPQNRVKQGLPNWIVDAKPIQRMNAQAVRRNQDHLPNGDLGRLVKAQCDFCTQTEGEHMHLRARICLQQLLQEFVPIAWQNRLAIIRPFAVAKEDQVKGHHPPPFGHDGEQWQKQFPALAIAMEAQQQPRAMPMARSGDAALVAKGDPEIFRFQN